MENEIEQEQEVVVEEQVVVEEPIVEEETVEELKKKLATVEAQKEHWRTKATTNKPVQSNSSLNAGDMMAIKNADLNPQDMDLVEKFARDNNISLREAISHPHAKAILAYEAELRTTAVASNVEGVRRGSVKVTDDTLIHNANAGKIPTSDDEIEQLIAAKMKYK